MRSMIALAALDLAASCVLHVGPDFVMTLTSVVLLMLAARAMDPDPGRVAAQRPRSSD